MKVIELKAENVKRLRAVEITPDGTLQVIGGRNAQGKSSVLDAIWLALGGGKAGRETARPIRDGESRAEVTLDLGDLRVTRTWTQKGTQLKVTSADGAVYSSPQAMLDGLVGQLSFDPLAFTRLSAREQREALMNLVQLDVDVDALDAERARLYEERTRVGQEGKALGDAAVDESLPVEEVSVSELLANLEAAQEHNAAVTRMESERESLTEAVASAETHLRMVQQELEEARQELAAAEKRVIPARVDVDALRAQVGEADERNKAIRANNAEREKAARKDALRHQYAALTGQITALDEQKQKALENAAFPVDGLGFDRDGVTYNGVPFSQASSAEQIRVSLAMAMALNPKLRVLRIMDGSLLDDEAMQLIREQVAAHDFQLWIERVGNADEGAVIIEDGEVLDK